MALHARPEEVLDIHARLTASLMENREQVKSYLGWFIRDAWEKNNDRGEGMFYPIVPKATRAEDIGPQLGNQLARLIGAGLQRATTYQVTAEMVQAMRGTYEATRTHLEHIEVQELPEVAGFAWLDESWGIMDMYGVVNRVRAVSWDFLYVATKGTDYMPVGPQMWPSARICLWTHVDDDRADGRLAESLIEGIQSDLGVLTLMHTACIPFDMRFGLPVDKSESSVESMLGLVHQLWMYLGMEIVATRRHQPSRAFHRRALKSLKHGEVHVVMLRRLIHPDTGEEVTHREVDWTCQWVVQGHWRHLEKPLKPHHAVAHVVTDPESKEVGQRCLQCDGELTWVRPYVKGPNGKPLKVSRTLMMLAR